MSVLRSVNRYLLGISLLSLSLADCLASALIYHELTDPIP